MKAKRKDKERREETNCWREIVADRRRIERERERWTGRKQMWFARTGNLQLEEYGLACKPHWNSRRARNCSGVELWASCCNLLFSLQPLASSFPLFVRAIVLNLSPSGCHLILTARSLRHPFKIPGWRTYQVVYTFIRVEFLCRAGKTLPEIVCTPASDVRPPLRERRTSSE